MKLSRENLQKLDKDDLIGIILELMEKLDQQGKRIQELERAARKKWRSEGFASLHVCVFTKNERQRI